MDGLSVNRHTGSATGALRHSGPPWRALTLWALAFGFVEAVLVVDLRHFLDPDADLFPLVQLPENLRRIEWGRESATLVVLVSASGLVAACRAARWATFLFLFGAWDLAYYGALRVLMGWPRGLTDWDLLFLIPVPWLAPVFAPMAIAALMVVVGIVTWRFESRHGCFRVRLRHGVAAALGAALCLGTFVHDAGARALESLPQRYPVEVLVAGAGVALLGYVDAWRLNRSRFV